LPARSTARGMNGDGLAGLARAATFDLECWRPSLVAATIAGRKKTPQAASYSRHRREGSANPVAPQRNAARRN
jgi:hypothetical protein